MKIQKSLSENISYIQTVFQDCGDIVSKSFLVGNDLKQEIFIAYIDTMVNRTLIETSILESIMFQIKDAMPKMMSSPDVDLFELVKNSGISSCDFKDSKDMDDAVNSVLSGDTVIFFNGYEKVLIVSTKGWPNRGIQTADTEVVVQGSKEAFSEVFRFNTVLIRRRIRDTNLKVVQQRVGKKSQTDVGIVYLDDLVRKPILDDVLNKIKKINIDAILDCGYIEQFIEDNWISPFPQIQVTERPDKAASAILEGRIVIVVDNSPFVLIVPCTFNAFFQSSEDYYQRWHIMSFVRFLRYIAGYMSICLPGLYIAIALYHPSMISLDLMLKISGSRVAVPFPAILEIILMDLAFELLREAGIRLPGAVGSTIGIVGGLIIGQAAVEAGLVSPIVVIIVALTGISSFAIPTVSIVNAFRLSKYLVLILSGALGLFGFWLSQLIIIIHLSTLKSFGIPYLIPFSSNIESSEEYKDSIIRAPLFMMKKRPIFANPNQKTRLSDIGKSHEKE